MSEKRTYIIPKKLEYFRGYMNSFGYTFKSSFGHQLTIREHPTKLSISIPGKGRHYEVDHTRTKWDIEIEGKTAADKLNNIALNMQKENKDLYYGEAFYAAREANPVLSKQYESEDIYKNGGVFHTSRAVIRAFAVDEQQTKVIFMDGREVHRFQEHPEIGKAFDELIELIINENIAIEEKDKSVNRQLEVAHNKIKELRKESIQLKKRDKLKRQYKLDDIPEQRWKELIAENRHKSSDKINYSAIAKELGCRHETVKRYIETHSLDSN